MTHMDVNAPLVVVECSMQVLPYEQPICDIVYVVALIPSDLLNELRIDRISGWLSNKTWSLTLLPPDFGTI